MTPLCLRRHEHVVDDHRVAVGAEHAGDGVAVDVGVDDAHLVALLGERDGEVDGDAALADAALAAGDQQRAGLVAGLVERHGLALGVAVAALRRRVAVTVAAAHHLAHLGALLVGHHREVEREAGDAGECGDRAADPVLDLVAQRATGHGERDLHADHAVVADLHDAHHAEVDDAAVQFGVFHGAQGVDDLLVGGCGHRGSPTGRWGSVAAQGNELPLRA